MKYYPKLSDKNSNLFYPHKKLYVRVGSMVDLISLTAPEDHNNHTSIVSNLHIESLLVENNGAVVEIDTSMTEVKEERVITHRHIHKDFIFSCRYNPATAIMESFCTYPSDQPQSTKVLGWYGYVLLTNPNLVD